MSMIELMGLILVRAQILEELMRLYIVDGFDRYRHARDVKGTFGTLKQQFKTLYPEEAELLGWLDIANEVRNEVAHSEFLVSGWIRDALEGHDSEAVDRFVLKGTRKSLWAIDECVAHFMRFRSNHPIQDGGGSPG